MLILYNLEAVVIPILIVILIGLVANRIIKRLQTKRHGGRLSINTERGWLIIRSLSLPALFIVPFFVNHFRQFPCPDPKVFAGPCYSINSGRISGWLGLLALIFGLVMLFSVGASLVRGQARAKMAKSELIYAFATVVVTAIIYIIFYHFSQARMLGLLPQSHPASYETLNKIQSQPFGVSFPIGYLIGFSVLFLIAPVGQWLQITRDKGRVAGVKKKELFQ